MKERDDTRPLGGWVQLDDAYWGGQRRGGWEPGRGAPGKTPFASETILRDAPHDCAARKHGQHPRRDAMT